VIDVITVIGDASLAAPVPTVLPIGDQTALVLLFIAGFALLLCTSLGALLALSRINPELFDRIEERLFGPLSEQQLAGTSETFPREQDGPAPAGASRREQATVQGRSAAAFSIPHQPSNRVCAPRERVGARVIPEPRS
jgi:hypothetical protein